MKLRVALSGVMRLYVETSPLIYYFEENPTYITLMDAIIDRMRLVPIEGVCSTIALAEVLTYPKRIGRTDLVQDYRDILLHSREFACLPLTVDMADRAADLRARYNLKTPDALQLAAAIEANCDAFLTNNLGLKRVTELRELVLDDIEHDSPPSSTP